MYSLTTNWKCKSWKLCTILAKQIINWTFLSDTLWNDGDHLYKRPSSSVVLSVRSSIPSSLGSLSGSTTSACLFELAGFEATLQWFFLLDTFLFSLDIYHIWIWDSRFFGGKYRVFGKYCPIWRLKTFFWTLSAYILNEPQPNYGVRIELYTRRYLKCEQDSLSSLLATTKKTMKT